MKVFMSWSGKRSLNVAKLLAKWLKCVLQACEPWISEDMERGVVWFNTINEALATTSTGIICLTAENVNSPWILFEAGSLSNGLTEKRVCTFLIDLKSSEVRPPLSQFNHTIPTKKSLLSLVKTINKRLPSKLDTETLRTAFNTYYPQFKKEFSEILTKTQVKEVRSEEDILQDVLKTTENLNMLLQEMKTKQKNNFEII